jgi:EmrB/QacA subfamily drug resistance transporter
VMSVIGVPMLLGPILGPVIGGAIVDQVSWRWIFFVNLPVGVAAVLFAQRLLPDAKPRLGERLDLRGLALLSPGIAIFLYGISEAGSEGGFGSARTIAAAAVGVALVALFVWHARARGKAALIDVSLFLRRGFATAAGVNFLLGLALFGSLILLPLYYQLVRHESPLQVGLLLAPQGIGAAVAMPLAGWLTDKIGARIVVTAGMLIAMGGMLAYTQLGAHTSYTYLAVALFTLGVGIGSTIMPSMAAAFQTLTHQETPRGTSAINVIQRIAGAIGTALLAITLQRTITSNLPNLHGGIQAIAALRQARQAQTAAPLAASFATTFWVAVALTATALLPALLLPQRRRQQHTAAETEAAHDGRAAA